MNKILILLFLAGTCFAQTSYLKKINEGSKDYFKLEKIYPNQTDGPRSIHTKINIPDYLSLSISIFSSKGDTVYTKLFENLQPGEYQFGWTYKGTVDTHYYSLDIMGFRISRKTMVFYYKLPFILY
jgi:hypothetical protein